MTIADGFALGLGLIASVAAASVGVVAIACVIALVAWIFGRK